MQILQDCELVSLCIQLLGGLSRNNEIYRWVEDPVV
jgi:hypothetical protein